MMMLFKSPPWLALAALCLWAMAAAAQAPAILVVGDSLSAGYGIDVDQGWVAKLQQRITAAGHSYRVVNASISGETTGGALSRIENLLTQHSPAIVIIELGANDGLRGLAIEHLRENLAAIIETSRAHDAKVLLLPMRLPENYGLVFTQRFRAVYEDLAKEYALPSTPFILQGFAENLRFMQEDGIHPKREAQALMLDNIWPSLQPLL